jgi:acetyl-CoA carboxylase biotin carboxylase subunit
MNGTSRKIARVLVANRGEIAVRIARGARESGIVPLGIYSEPDRHAAHVDAMDDAVCIGPGPATDSYLNIERVIAAARELRADSVHPGYGFLSEREAFARAVRDAGMIFIGPTPESIASMGDKTEAKHRAREFDVPVVPGYDGEDQSLETLAREAAQIGLPLLIKASAGGGGRGMRVVKNLENFAELLESAQREALGSFGDAKVLLERYLTNPRHIEFQIVADEHGNTFHLGERECSIQRRHHKVLQEAPSIALDDDLRARMGEAAIRVAKSVGYTNAGTVEFLLDEDGSFYFLEMNARLQVEHPVTELVHGVDLVRMQFAIANGARLSASDIPPARGWAIEARINAEDPNAGYMPAIGTITRYDPPHGPGIRLDSGVRKGSEVSVFYDSMLAKLIAYGPTRQSAIERLTHAIEDFHIEGVYTNLPLQLLIARDVTFRAGYTTTAFMEEHGNFLRPDPTGDPEEAFLLAIGAIVADPRSWRVGSMGIPIRLTGQRRTIAVVASRAIDGDGWTIEGDIAGAVAFEVDGDRVAARSGANRAAGRATLRSNGVDVVFNAHPYHLAFAPPPTASAAGSAATRSGKNAIVSPMPGKIVKVAVAAGDVVAERDLLLVLEAMKMEHRIEAARDGVVKSVAVSEGALVGGGAMLVELEG